MNTLSDHRDFCTRAGIRHPVIQGPFGGGLSTIELTSTVSNLGGMGSYGAHHLAPDAINPVVRQLRTATTEPFAVNLWISNRDPAVELFSHTDFETFARLFAPYFKELGLAEPTAPVRYGQQYEQQVEALLEARPPVFSFVFGIPSADILQACRQRDILTVGAATSVAEALALEAAGVDAIVATGFEAGGHRPSFLASAEESLMGTFVLTQLVAARVKVPVIAAGGIASHAGLQAALVLGASAVQVGTAFLACRESGTSDEHRELLFGERAYRTTLTRAFSGRLARGLCNRWTDVVAPALPELAPYPIQNWFMGQMRSAAIKAGRTDLVSLWSGQIAPVLRYHDAASVFDSLINGPVAAG